MLYTFASFEFETEAGELRRNGRMVPLEPQPARALALLVGRAGEVVSREELAAHVWGPDTHIDFNRGLAYCIAQIRTALGDSGENSRFVQTVPKRGFRFIAPVKPAGDTPASAAENGVAGQPVQPAGLGRWQWELLGAGVILALLLVGSGLWAVRQHLTQPRPIVAVSLFDNETGDSRYDHTVHALSDVVVDRLTQLGPGQIGVVGNASVLRVPRNQRDLKAIAEQTGARFVILAQLQNKDQGLSFMMQLIRLDDGTHVWTRRIARPAGDGLHGLDEDAARMLEAAARQFILVS